MVISKDVLWYVLDDLGGYLSRLVDSSKRYVYIGQSFPEQRPFLGEQHLPNAASLSAFVEQQEHRVIDFLVERDAEYSNHKYAHLLIEIK